MIGNINMINKRAVVFDEGGGAEPPKQTTDETGVYSTPVSDYHDKLSTAALEYTFHSTMAARGLSAMDIVVKFSPGPTGLFTETSGEWIKVRGGLPIEEYEKMFGSRLYPKVKNLIEKNKYRVYDDTQEKDPATGLYPEYDFSMRNGFWIKLILTRFDGDPRPDLDIEVKETL